MVPNIYRDLSALGQSVDDGPETALIGGSVDFQGGGGGGGDEIFEKYLNPPKCLSYVY